MRGHLTHDGSYLLPSKLDSSVLQSDHGTYHEHCICNICMNSELADNVQSASAGGLSVVEACIGKWLGCIATAGSITCLAGHKRKSMSLVLFDAEATVNVMAPAY